jgi:hypothetical protein
MAAHCAHAAGIKEVIDRHSERFHLVAGALIGSACCATVVASASLALDRL